MSIYNVDESQLQSAYGLDGSAIYSAFNVTGTLVFSSDVDYSHYSFTQKWASKGISAAQGLDIVDNIVFWVSKSGDSTVPANLYTFNLSDGSQALPSAYITVYSGHGNNICFSPNKSTLMATPAYPPSRVFLNSVGTNYAMTLSKTLTLNDGSTDCDACFDPNDDTIMYSVGHTNNSSDLSAPFKISKWDLSNLTDNGDGTFTPDLISSVETAQPSNSYFFQGCKYHDGLLWFASGYGGGSTDAYVYAVEPTTGNKEYTIDLNTTAEPEGLAWVADSNVYGGYVLYVGFAGMMLRKYTFSAS